MLAETHVDGVCFEVSLNGQASWKNMTQGPLFDQPRQLKNT